jgi:hypothetical protein
MPRNHSLQVCTATLALVVYSAAATNTFAQNIPNSQLAVDVVTLKSGVKLRGAFMGRDANRIVSMAVQRKWLKKNQEAFYAEQMKAENEAALKSNQALKDRVQSWLDEEPDQNLMVAFLKGEMRELNDRIATIKEDGVDAQFVVVRFPDKDIRSKYSQKPANRKLALLAWEEEYKDVENRKATDLLKALERDGYKPADEIVDLSSRLPVRRQGAREWGARRAIVEFSFGDKLEYQGMGDALFRTGGEEKPDLAKILPQILQSALTSQVDGLQELLGEPGLNVRQKPAAKKKKLDFSGPIAEAQRLGVRSFRVTSLDLNPTAGRAAVTGRYVVKMPNGKWETIWQATSIEDASKARPDFENQIKNDPQLKQITGLLNGLGGGLDGQLNTAIRFGGATMDAQKKADQAFFKFRDKFMRRLSSPPVRLPTAPAADSKN